MAFKWILIGLASLIVSACSSSSINLNVPQYRFDLPEAVGKKEISAELSYHSDEYVAQLSDNPYSDPVNTTNPRVLTQSPSSANEGLREIDFGLSYGFTDQFEFGIKGSRYTLKYMLLGEPQLRAKAGNWSLALTLGYGKSSESGDDWFPIFNSTPDYKYLLEFRLKDLAVISGYRIQDRLLCYGGIFTTQYEYTVDLTNTDTSQTSHSVGDASVTGVNVGLHIGLTDESAFEIEQIYSRLEVGESSLNSGFTGINFRTRF